MENEKRLIDATEARKHATHDIITHFLDRCPTVDAVEVVPCKDCKHCSNNTPDGLHWCDEHEIGSLMDDDFCSYGERKDRE